MLDYISCWSNAVLSFKAFFHTECNSCFLFLVLFLIRDNPQAAFSPDFLSNSDIRIDTEKKNAIAIINI